MKSPSELSYKLERQWRNPNIREKRLLTQRAWPIRLPIGKPTSREINENIDQVRSHLELWRTVLIGEIEWGEVNYRDTSDAITVPLFWNLNKPSEWIDAIGTKAIKKEFQKLSRIVQVIKPIFHILLVRQYHLVLERLEEEIIKSTELALILEPKCAKEAPLRMISYLGIDSKFFERNYTLIVKLLDVRFNGIVSDLGLENFLGALKESDHWLLVADLSGESLPFNQMRVRSHELYETPISASHILIIENEKCLHHLPELPDTVAILGGGLDLSWTSAKWLSEKKIAYWGDIDTWGLTMLSRVKKNQPSLTTLLMTEFIYNNYSPSKTVPEPKVAGPSPPIELDKKEAQLYMRLLNEKKGRLEQEFIPKDDVVNALYEWREKK